MFRSLITLLALANLTAGNFMPVAQPISTFDETDLLTVHSIPVKNSQDISPVIEAKAALVMDLDSGDLLYEKNIHDPLPMASLTKIMTAVLILESHDLNEVVTIEDNYTLFDPKEIGVRIWLHQYEKITVENLLIALLVRSAGDAALALATHHSGSVDAFVDTMNQRAESLNLTHTHFINPIGIDADGHYSSAFDLALLTKHALRFPVFREIVQIERAEVTSTNEQIKHGFKSTNDLLDSYLDIRGVKTGTTEAAGQSLINLAVNRRHEIVSVLLNSPNRFQENKSLIDWVFRTYTW